VTTVSLLVVPILTTEYDYRFTIPAFGPLAATAAMGMAGSVRMIRQQRPRSRRTTP
jgi:hypothetical protein